MNLRENMAGETQDPELELALRNFKASVDAWSRVAYSRPRTAAKVVRHSWRLAASWALGCVLAAGSLAGAMFERQQRQELARIAAAKKAAQIAAQQRLAAQRSAVLAARQKDDNLLATVDSDVSRQVPAAMEPLARMMDENGTQ